MVTVRIDRPDDGDADTPNRAINEPAPGALDEPGAPDPPEDGSSLRQQRSRDYRANADAIYHARGAAHRPAAHHSADRDQARAIDEGCARVERIERETVTPAMRRIEAEDPDRRLAGLEHPALGNRRRILIRLVTDDGEKRGIRLGV